MTTESTIANVVALTLVIAGRETEFLSKIESFGRRAEKLGLEKPVATKVGSEKETVYEIIETHMGPMQTENIIGYRVWYHYEVTHSDLRLPGGWRFLGSVEHISKTNILRLLCSDEEAKKLNLEQYRTSSKNHCDHCGTHRNRKDTYIVANDKGEVKRVGKSCLKDFLGHDAARGLGLLAQLPTLEDGEWRQGGPRVDFYDLEHVVGLARQSIVTDGWVSRSEGNGYATADKVAEMFHKVQTGNAFTKAVMKRKFEQAKEDTFASCAIAWALANDSDTTYMLNLKAICELGVCEMRHFGLVCSLAKVYQDHLNREAERQVRESKQGQLVNEFFGEKGDKIGRKLSKKDKAKGAKAFPARKATITQMNTWDGAYGVTTLINMVDEDGYTLVWFKSREEEDLKVGDEVNVVATIKGQKEYKGTKQTLLTLCNLTKIN